MSYKQPHSIQVVIFTITAKGREFLLLRRVAAQGGFWQSVTGSLEVGETHTQAAVREVFEETGIVCNEADLINLHLTNTFEIAPLWRAKFAPHVTHNREVCFALKVETQEIRLDALEHEDSLWTDFDNALTMLYWESSRKAFRKFHSLAG
jgi:dATP pyrophosphohydrolase